MFDCRWVHGVHPQKFWGIWIGICLQQCVLQNEKGFSGLLFFLGFTFIYGVSIFLGAAINTIKLPWSGSFVPFLLSRWGWFCRWVYHMTICFPIRTWATHKAVNQNPGALLFTSNSCDLWMFMPRDIWHSVQNPWEVGRIVLKNEGLNQQKSWENQNGK